MQSDTNPADAPEPFSECGSFARNDRRTRPRPFSVSVTRSASIGMSCVHSSSVAASQTARNCRQIACTVGITLFGGIMLTYAIARSSMHKQALPEYRTA
ncbi:MAG: hypothetical protein JO250_05480 [Armatimonadetes bacterium]|nr:hypothetical protein [Armatimonadota bacterium]